ncbi:class I SAM-dependent DNA methyltransferase [Saccharopolyspora phatthalungensis]|uniref:SAM-dependent methyltransferase n=1 Tax=Saccharopolyspora phatthalungensis TaxID=664693 RepID=A0A840QB57_9PSEU|nr:class I SAM-dependent methyltransferase [Saccharopolyspora phatthalungensis]MBB5157994.1 SAM-dependent methyltransferase [Saccharopolyspora phatthalungensis]
MHPNIVSANFLTDNPAIYEQRFPDPEYRAARFVDDLVGRFGAGRDLLDVGCGTGRDARYWTACGYRVTGLDCSPQMVEHAQAHCPEATFVVADMRSFEALSLVGSPGTPTDSRPGFDVITCLDSALLYCHTNDDLDAFLQRCRDNLRPGGLLIAELRNGAFFLGNTELLDEVREQAVVWDGVEYRSRTRLWIDHAEQLLRRERHWAWPGRTEPLIQHSAWRLLFPQELRYFSARHGFEVVAMFDEPGPRAETPWRPEAPLSTRLSGDRLHVVLRR